MAQLLPPRWFKLRLRFMGTYLSGQLMKRLVYSENISPTRVTGGSLQAITALAQSGL